MRKKGTVKWFNSRKGYGFIIFGKKDDKEAFVHHSDIKLDGYRTLRAKTDVFFDLNDTERGPQASNVVPA